MRSQLDKQQLLLYAVRGEKASFSVYTHAAAAAGNPVVAKLLNQLARDELGHLFALLKRSAKVSPEILGAVDMTVPVPDAGVVERLSRAQSVEEVLRAALREEHASLTAYAQLTHAVSGEARAILQTIRRRERRHVSVLEALLRQAAAHRGVRAEGGRAH